MFSIAYWRTDASLKALNALFTFGSCGLSGYAGWLLASDLGQLVQIVTAVTFGAIAYGLSEAIQWRTRYRLARDKEGFARNGRLALFLLVANLLTDYSASSTLRDQANTVARNANNIARMAQGEVKRIEKAMQALRQETAWRTPYEAPATYDALISQQKQIVDRGANVWQRTRECTDTTLPVSSQVCSEIKRLEAEKANAERRQVILSELRVLGEQLAQAKQEAANAPEAGNPALAPIIGLVTMASQSLEHGEGDVKWGMNYFVLTFTIIMSAAIWYLSTEIAHRAGPMRPPETPDDYWAVRKAIAASEAHEPRPIPLKAEPAPVTSSSTETVTTYSYSGHEAPSASQRLRELIEHHQRKAEALRAQT